jgi:hypothetical protein
MDIPIKEMTISNRQHFSLDLGEIGYLYEDNKELVPNVCRTCTGAGFIHPTGSRVCFLIILNTIGDSVYRKS